MASPALNIARNNILAFTSKTKATMPWDEWLAAVLTANNRAIDTNALTSNEFAFLRNRHKEGKKSRDVTI